MWNIDYGNRTEGGNTPPSFKLVVKDSGEYTADSFTELIWIVIKHRFEHLFKGEGFID